MTQIALFGTSADPPTSGHQAILLWLSQRFDKVVVWASDNPFKTHQTLLEHRMAMLSLLIEEINAQKANIALHPELSSRRTLETLKRAKNYWSDADYTLVVGSDLVQQIPQWYQIETLLKQVELLIIPRPRLSGGRNGFRSPKKIRCDLNYCYGYGFTRFLKSLSSNREYRGFNDPGTRLY